MKWYRNLYIGESIDKTIDEIISDVETKKDVRKKYLITFPANENNMLDIITADMGIIITWREVHVIGVAGSKKEAVELTSQIISEAYNSRGDLNLEEYFNDFI